MSNPVYYILNQLFYHYSSYEEKIKETAGIFAGLYHIAKNGHMSVGTLHKLWTEYYEEKKRVLPEQVYDYISKLFAGEKIDEWPPPLFDIDRYGSIISFHGSVDRTLIRMIKDPYGILKEIKEKTETIDKEIGYRNRENIEENLRKVLRGEDTIKNEVEIFSKTYFEDLHKWIASYLIEWKKKEQEIRDSKDKWYQRCKKHKLEIPAIKAYYFLSMFKEFVEPSKKFDITKYNEFKILVEDIFRRVYVKPDIFNPSLSTTVYRLLYYLFEKARSADLIQKAKLEQDPLSRPILDNKGELLYQFGAYDTDLDILLEDYFPEKNIQQEPIVNGGDRAKLLLFRRVGLSLMTIGRLVDADLIYTKSYSIANTRSEWSIDTAKVLQLKSELYIHMGRLMDSINASNSAISIYMQIYDGDYCSTGQELWGVQNVAMGPIQLIICSLSYQAWVLHLVGCHEYADIAFKEAEKLGQKINPNPGNRPDNKYYQDKPRPMQHLRDLWGIYHADYLLRINDEESIELAKLITLENLEYTRM